MEKQKKQLYHTLIITYIILLLPVLKMATPNNDLYFLASMGRHIMENGIPHENPFFIEHGFSIVIQQWLGCILNYIVYTKYQNAGLLVLTLIYTILSIFMQIKLIRLFTTSRKQIIIVLYLNMALFLKFYNLRGSILTISLLIAEVYLLIKYSRTSQTRYLTGLPIISLLLINWQAAMWIFLFILALPFLLPKKLHDVIYKTCMYYKKTAMHYLKLITTLLVSVVMGFFNPYGIENILYIFNSISTVNKQAILEHKPTEVFTLPFMIILIYTIAIVCNIAKNKMETNMQSLCLSAGCIILALMMQRNIWFASLATTQLIENMTALSKGEFLKRAEELLMPPSKAAYRILQGIFIVFCTISLFIFYKADYSCASEKNDNRFIPKSAIEYLNNAYYQDEVKILSSFDNGGYFEWKGGYKVYIDPRAEAYSEKINKKRNIYEIYVDLQKNLFILEREIGIYDFSHIFAEKDTPLYFYMLKMEGYEPVLDNNLTYQLFEKTDITKDNPKNNRQPHEQNEPEENKDEFKNISDLFVKNN